MLHRRYFITSAVCRIEVTLLQLSNVELRLLYYSCRMSNRGYFNTAVVCRMEAT